VEIQKIAEKRGIKPHQMLLLAVKRVQEGEERKGFLSDRSIKTAWNFDERQDNFQLC